MKVFQLHIAGQTFVLDHTQNLAILHEQMAAAKSADGGYVEFVSKQHGRVDVLLSRAVPAWIDTVNVSDVEPDAKHESLESDEIVNGLEDYFPN